MNKFTKDHNQRRTELLAKLADQKTRLVQYVEIANQKIDEIRDNMQGAIDGYNEVLEDLRELQGEIVNEISLYIDEKSEKWQDSEKGQQYVTWKDDIENVDLADIEIELPESIDDPDPSHAEEVEAWHEEPEY